MARIQYIPNRVIDTNGIADAAEVYLYQFDTTTKVPLFSDDTLSVPILNPVVVPAGAEIPIFYTSYTGPLRLRVIQSDGSISQDDNPYQAPVGAGDLSSTGPGKGGDLVYFKHDLPQAQAESVSDTLERTVWADQFKTILDLDDTNCIQRAINSGAGEILLTDRTYSISEVINVTGILRIVGKGRRRTIVNQTDLTKGGFSFSMAFLQGCGLENMTIKGNAASEQAAGSTGIGVKVANCNDNATFRCLDISNFDTSFQIVGCYQLLLDDFRFLYFRTAGLHIAPYTGAAETAGAGNRFMCGKISNFGFSGTNTSSTGILIEQASGEFLNTIDVTTCNNGITIKPTATSYARYLFLFQVLGDSCLNRNWLIDGSLGVVVANDAVQCWSSNSQGDGVEFKGAAIDAFSWNGGWNRDNRFHGFTIGAGTNVEVQACEITRNSAAANDTYHGVNIPAGSNVIARILDCRIGNVSTTVGTSTQKDNVFIGAGVTGLVEVSQCDLNNAGTGGLPLNCVSTVVQKQFRGNLPQASVGTNFSDRYAISFHSINQPAAGSTTYIGAGGALSGTSSSLLIPGKFAAVVGLRIRVPSPPGASQSFAYTVFKNGVATSMAGSIGPGQFSLDIPDSVGAFQVAEADSVNVRLVTSAGAAVTYHNLALVIEP